MSKFLKTLKSFTDKFKIKTELNKPKEKQDILINPNSMLPNQATGMKSPFTSPHSSKKTSSTELIKYEEKQKTSITPGSWFGNVVTGMRSPFKSTFRSKETSLNLVKNLLFKPSYTKFIYIGHSEGGQNNVRASEKESLDHAVETLFPVSFTSSDGSWDEHSVEGMENQDKLKDKVNKAVKNRVKTFTAGSPSASSGNFRNDIHYHAQHVDDLVAKSLYGNGSRLLIHGDGFTMSNMFTIYRKQDDKPGGHGYQYYEPYVQQFIEDHADENTEIIHSGGMFTSQKEVTKRAETHSAAMGKLIKKDKTS